MLNDDTKINFDVALKKIQQEGTLAWEYNPFRNYRLDEDMIYYKNQFYTIEKFYANYIDIENIPITYIEVIEETNSDGKSRQYKVNYDQGKTYPYQYADNKKGYKATKDRIDIQTFTIVYKYRKSDEGDFVDFNEQVSDWGELGFSKTEEQPIFYQKGSLVDFITDELNFDLNHPVQITPQYSYDNSVDLIINDGISKPKIINSRFSTVGKNKYKIIDRNGNNDTNIYDRGAQFDIDTSLYKVTSKIPRVSYGGISYGGNLKVGNYHFYFKYSDLDGNETDFVAQSGLVNIFIGNTPSSIHSGFRDQNSNKKVRFLLSNIDLNYDYLIVYYSRASSEEYQNRAIECSRIEQKYKISEKGDTVVNITGFEEISKQSIDELNLKLQIYESAKTQAVAQNMLFLGNVTQSNDYWDKLSKLALYIIPQLNNNVICNINSFGETYNGSIQNTYYDPAFTYRYTGYWDDEIYRFGVVFIKNNNTLTPVYNIRGLHLDNNNIELDPLERGLDKGIQGFEDNELVTYDETTFEIDTKVSTKFPELENAKGVCYIPPQNKLNEVIGIDFKCDYSVIKWLKVFGIKGFFIVRQKRIPTTLCQAITIATENVSHTPVIPYESNYIAESFLDNNKNKYVYFEDGKKKSDSGYLISQNFNDHKRVLNQNFVKTNAAICPDYDVNSTYLNSLFTGTEYTIVKRGKCEFTNKISRLFDAKQINEDLDTSLIYLNTKIIGVEDNVKLVGIDDQLFSARAGEAEEAKRFEYLKKEVKKDDGGCDIIRGSFGPYLGLSSYSNSEDLITIKIPNYNVANMRDYFKIRYFDAAPFYPISDRIEFPSNRGDFNENLLTTCYRGDCYIVKFTHRLNRNFRDPSAPTNDMIVDPATWAKNMKFEDDVMKTDNLDKINLGDINSVNLGMWVSFILRSNINHSIRSIDESNIDEVSQIGHARGFYPYHPLAANSAYKLPECGTYNDGMGVTVGEQIYNELPLVPYYKDIFSTRIAYSNIQISSAFRNAYRVFPATNYRDYPITYGEITKIIEWNGDLMCILEHGVYRIPINERAVAGQGSGGTIFINTSNVLPENPNVISDTFGSQWSDSIIKTPTGIYGVDTVGKKIWKVDDNGMELISDFKVQEFLNNNITLTERELTPIIGIRNVKTHYNAFKHDVMFTFYDDISGPKETVWNLCWNETMNKWITFYSWVPSFSENIYNQYFSFDRESSKQIAKLALNEKSEQNDSIYLDHTLMKQNSNYIGTLCYDIKSDKATTFKWEIIKDIYGNNEFFRIDNNKLYYNGNYDDFVKIPSSEVLYGENSDIKYILSDNGWTKEGDTTPLNKDTDFVLISQLNRKRKQNWIEDLDTVIKSSNNNKPTIRKVYILNIKVTPTFIYANENPSYAEFIATKSANMQLTGGSIERTIAIIPEDHLEALSTDFWRHGQTGIIDITEDITPTKWYGKQHPFEFEFIVRDQPDTHKIFDNLIIISNKAEPESFHYEIIGECYEFAKDKKNMYIRQEATKELFYQNGYDVSYNENYKDLTSEHRLLKTGSTYYDKSTIFPAYYCRQDSLNAIEDYYHERPGEQGKNFSQMTGSEIVYYKNLKEFRIWEHAKGTKVEGDTGLLRGNMKYLEDKWYVQISPINLVQCNEPDWNDAGIGGIPNTNNVPIELNHSTFKDIDNIDIDTNISPLKERAIVAWDEDNIKYSEIKPKDKYIKIRIRYSGNDLAIISAIKTLYSISYA